MSEAPKITVEDLLPALTELASIQKDLLQALEHPKASASYNPTSLAARNRAALGSMSEPIGIDTASLRERSVVLLNWLLHRAREIS